MKKCRTVLLNVLALATSPLILFVSTSNQLFILNQVDLGFNPAVMYPFLALGGIMWAAGVIVYAAPRSKLLHYLLWCYLLTGPVFLLASSVGALGNSRFGSLISVAGFSTLLLVVAWLFSARVRVERSATLFATFAVLLAGFESYQFVTRVDREAPVPESVAQVGERGTPEASLPNIYVLLLDEYQTDMFELTLSPDVRDALGGFKYYPANTAVYGRTGMSLPSIFSGRMYDVTRPQRDYRDSAFNSEQSLFYWLKEAGYSLYAYVRDDVRAKFDLGLFDVVEEHEDTRALSVLSGVVEKFSVDAFRDLWIIRHLPQQVAVRVLGAERLEALKSGNVLPKSANISSYYGFVRYLQEEQDLPANSRFTFIYLLLPHFPYVFTEDCSYAEDLATSGPRRQATCTTSLVVQFLEELKRLGRFADSTILVLSDHGARFEVSRSRLQSVETQGTYSKAWSRARSRALLLVKPAGTDDSRQLVTSSFGSTLTDIAPTILDTVGLEPPADLDGLSLLDPGIAGLDRTRLYYFYDKKGPNGWTDELVRFTITGAGVSDGEPVKLEYNPTEAPYTYARRTD